MPAPGRRGAGAPAPQRRGADAPGPPGGRVRRSGSGRRRGADARVTPQCPGAPAPTRRGAGAPGRRRAGAPTRRAHQAAGSGSGRRRGAGAPTRQRAGAPTPQRRGADAPVLEWSRRRAGQASTAVRTVVAAARRSRLLCCGVVVRICRHRRRSAWCSGCALYLCGNAINDQSAEIDIARFHCTLRESSRCCSSTNICVMPWSSC